MTGPLPPRPAPETAWVPWGQALHDNVTALRDFAGTAVTDARVAPDRVVSFAGTAGSAPNPAEWTSLDSNGSELASGLGFGNGESQSYRPSNAKLDGAGNLIITAERLTTPYLTRSYVAARLHGRFDVPAGSYVEVPAKLPTGAGVFPAVWSMGANYDQFVTPTGTPQPWPVCGELDIMEATGLTPNTARFAIHKNQTGSTTVNAFVGWAYPGTTERMTRPVTDWHTWGLYHDADRVVAYLDRVPRFEYTRLQATMGDPMGGGIAASDWPFGQAVRLILNVAVGPTTTPDLQRVIGDPAATTFPRTMTVGAISIWNGGFPF